MYKGRTTTPARFTNTQDLNTTSCSSSDGKALGIVSESNGPPPLVVSSHGSNRKPLSYTDEVVKITIPIGSINNCLQQESLEANGKNLTGWARISTSTTEEGNWTDGNWEMRRNEEGLDILFLERRRNGELSSEDEIPKYIAEELPRSIKAGRGRQVAGLLVKVGAGMKSIGNLKTTAVKLSYFGSRNAAVPGPPSSCLPSELETLLHVSAPSKVATLESIISAQAQSSMETLQSSCTPGIIPWTRHPQFIQDLEDSPVFYRDANRYFIKPNFISTTTQAKYSSPCFPEQSLPWKKEH